MTSTSLTILAWHNIQTAEDEAVAEHPAQDTIIQNVRASVMSWLGWNILESFYDPGENY